MLCPGRDSRKTSVLPRGNAMNADQREEAMAEALGYRFRDAELLRRALTHPSRRIEAGFSYERLEFLGDAVIGLTVAEHLFRTCPDRNEGDLTKMKSSVVSGRSLASVARRIKLQDLVIVDKGIAAQKRLPPSVLSDVFEALIGAVFLEDGIAAAQEVILRLLAQPIEDAVSRKFEPDYKSRLQEWAHVALRETPSYVLLDTQGPPHTKRFQTAVVIAEQQYGVAWGSSKRAAEQEAAAETLRQLDGAE